MTKILVIEDEIILREEILEWLTMEGYTAMGAEDGLVGVEYALHHLPDLIVCDILMPHLDGYGVLVEVHADPATAGIPFIFLTAKAAHDDVRRGMNLGADDYISKPFTRLALLQAIQARLAKKSVQMQEHQREIAQLQQALTQAHEHRLLRAKLIDLFSHDFTNSLTSILMTNSLLRSAIAEMDAKRRLAHLNRIESSARLLLQMLDDLLVIAQLETGTLDLESEMLNVNKFFQRIREDCQAIYGERYSVLLESQSNGLVWVDTRLLRLITTNLLTYVTQVSPKGSTVRVFLNNRAEACRLTIQVFGADTAKADRLNSLQQSSDGETVTSAELELAVVKQAVAFHGGSIQFNNGNDVGITITVVLPSQQDKHAVNARTIVGIEG